MTNEQLIDGIYSQDKHTWEYFYRKYLNKIRRELRKTWIIEDIEDSIQDSAIKVRSVIQSKNNSELQDYINKYKNSFYEYCKRIVKYDLINNYRIRTRIKTTFIDEILASVFGDDSETIKEQALQNERNLLFIKKYIDNIDPVCKEIFNLRYYQEKNFFEIAELLGFNDHLKARHKSFRCRKHLKNIIIADPDYME